MAAGSPTGLGGRCSTGNLASRIADAERTYDEQAQALVQRIIESSPAVRVVLVAGPSASGKTTLAQRIVEGLAARGRPSLSLCVDDYYKPRSEVSVGPDGLLNYETIDAIDTSLLRDHIQKLLAGKPVVVPQYDYEHGSRYASPADGAVHLDGEGVVVVEGIHALCDTVTSGIPRATTMRVYVEPKPRATGWRAELLGADDIRLLRRICRDARTRGYTPAHTLRRWNAVLEADRTNLHPFKDGCDVRINSFLDYEVGVLRRSTESQLRDAVRALSPQDADIACVAKKLLTRLGDQAPIDTIQVPPSSPLREFVG